MANPVSAADLATARTAAESLMTDSVVIKRPTVAKSDTGGNKPTYTTVATTVCRKVDLELRLRAMNSEVQNELDPSKLAEFLFPWNTDLRTEDQMVVSEGIFQVLEVESRSTLIQLRCLAYAHE